MVNKKKIHYLCVGGIEKSVSRDHRLSSLRNEKIHPTWSPFVITRVMTNGDHEGRIFLSHPHTHDVFLISARMLRTFLHGTPQTQ